MNEAIRYCEYLDGECDYLICSNCKYNPKKKEKELWEMDPDIKLYRVSYEVSLIISMPEPCGILKTTNCKGEILLQAQTEAAAESAAHRMIENNFVYDDIVSIEVKEEPIPPDEFPCKECNFNSNGTCVLII